MGRSVTMRVDINFRNKVARIRAKLKKQGFEKTQAEVTRAINRLTPSDASVMRELGVGSFNLFKNNDRITNVGRNWRE